MSVDVHYSLDDLTALISPTLGHERSVELLREALGALEIRGAVISLVDARRVLEHLGKTAGVTGTVARFALARLALVDPRPSPTHQGRTETAIESRRRDTHGPTSEPMLSRGEIAALLAPTIGEEKSNAVVTHALARAGFPREMVTLSQALDTLENLGGAEGLVGVAARFARMRLQARQTRG